MIEAKGLTKYYGSFRAIHDVSFHVKEGEIVAFLGPNAAGKTTTMRILTCFMPATYGTALIAGHDIYEDSISARRAIGYLPETAAVYPEMTPIQYLEFMAKLRGVSRSELYDRLDDVIDKCRLHDYLDTQIGKLSKGFRQRVGLAQALVHDPPILILDEPTIGLDPGQVVETRQMVKRLAGDHTVMLSTHVLPEAQMICDRVIIINNGQIVAEDTREDLTQRLRHRDTLYVRVRDQSPMIRRELQAMRDVQAVRPEEEGAEGAGYYVESRVGTDLRPELAKFIVEKGWSLLELRKVDMSLEEVFLQLTAEEERTQ